MCLPRGQGGAVRIGPSRKPVGAVGERGASASGLRGPVVAGQAGEAGGEFVEPAAPGAESGAEDAEGVAAAAEGVAAVVVGVGRGGGRWREQRGGAGAGVPPGCAAGPGRATAAPRIPRRWSRPRRWNRHWVAAVRSGADWGTPNTGQSGVCRLVGSSRLPFKGWYSTLDTGGSPLSSTAGVSCADVGSVGSGRPCGIGWRGGGGVG